MRDPCNEGNVLHAPLREEAADEGDAMASMRARGACAGGSGPGVGDSEYGEAVQLYMHLWSTTHG